MAPANKPVRDVMMAAVPSLRAFAISLCGNLDRADDLVQEALLRAWANLDSFEPGTNMSAWLFTILRICSARSIASGAARWRMPMVSMRNR
jgi:RNA polymerase sigma-70 factor, ECF subfamily